MNINFAIEKVQSGILKEARMEKANRQEVYDYNSELIKEAFSNVIEAYISEFAVFNKQVFITDAYNITFYPDREILAVKCYIDSLIKNIILRFEALGKNIKNDYSKVSVYDYIYDYLECNTVSLVKSLVDELSKYYIPEDSIENDISNSHKYPQYDYIMFTIDLADWNCLRKQTEADIFGSSM